MGLMRFHVLDPGCIDQQSLDRACLVGPEDLPFAGRTYMHGDHLIVERREDASAYLWMPWTLPSHGQWMLSTSSLMERQRPYQLEVELARGAVFRVRNQLAMWEQLGLQSTADIQQQVIRMTRLFARAATRQDNPRHASMAANEALSSAADASVQLASLYANQAIQGRVSVTPKLPTLIGVRLGETTPASNDATTLASACSMVAAPASWKSVEESEGKRHWEQTDKQIKWAQKENLRVACGPLLEFDELCVPEWAYLWEGDFEAIASLMIAHVQATVSRYKGRVQLWNIAARVNRVGVLSLSDEQRLQLTARAIRTAREIDSRTPMVVSFDQPWGEYLTNSSSELGPLDYADALERADLGVSGFGMELNIGYAPDGSSPRSPLELSRLLDQWSLRLELPLMVAITAPSSAEEDPLASSGFRVIAGGVASALTEEEASTDEKEDDTHDTHVLNEPLPSSSASDTQEFTLNQAHDTRRLPVDEGLPTRWAEQNLPILIAKNCVQVVFWNQYRDDEPHQFPHGGCVTRTGEPKEVLTVIKRLRDEYLV